MSGQRISHQLRWQATEGLLSALVRDSVLRLSSVEEARRLVDEAGFDRDDVAQCVLVEKVIELVAYEVGKRS